MLFVGLLRFEKTSVLDGTFSSPLCISNAYFYVQWTHKYTDSQTKIFFSLFHFHLYVFLSFCGTGFKPRVHECLGKHLSMNHAPALYHFQCMLVIQNGQIRVTVKFLASSTQPSCQEHSRSLPTFTLKMEFLKMELLPISGQLCYRRTVIFFLSSPPTVLSANPTSQALTLTPSQAVASTAHSEATCNTCFCA